MFQEYESPVIKIKRKIIQKIVFSMYTEDLNKYAYSIYKMSRF